MTIEKSCGAVVFTRDHGLVQYLIIQSKEGFYGFPKGHIEPGEQEEETALREIWEETGLTVHATEYRGVVDFHCTGWPDERMHLFWSNSFSGTPKECDEGTLEWVPISQMDSLPQWEGDRLFLKLLQEKAPF